MKQNSKYVLKTKIIAAERSTKYETKQNKSLRETHLFMPWLNLTNQKKITIHSLTKVQLQKIQKNQKK